MCLFLLYSQPLSDVFRIEVLNVEETCVSLNDVDEQFVVQSIGKCEEVVGIEEVVAIKIVDDLRNEAFSVACIHSGRSHNNFGYRNRKQSMRVIGNASDTLYRPYFI